MVVNLLLVNRLQLFLWWDSMEMSFGYGPATDKQEMIVSRAALESEVAFFDTAECRQANVRPGASPVSVNDFLRCAGHWTDQERRISMAE
jgi:hypothetical protein